MDCIRFLSIVRRVERAAARRGYSADCLVDDDNLPDTGTFGEQLDTAAILLDANVGPLSTGERELVNRLARRCVLSPRPAASQPLRPAARRRVV